MTRPGIPINQSYFDSKVYLSVSGQLHLEAMSYGLGNTYTFLPAFRAENSKSPLHLSEFYMFEAEMLCNELQQLSSFIENMIKSVTQIILDKCEADLQICYKKSQANVDLTWLNRKWTTLTYDEALEIIQNNSKQFKSIIKENEGFSKEHEFFLVHHCATPVFVIDWPTDQKPFYMAQTKQNPNRVYALDLLMPSVGELCGGSLREANADTIRKHPKFPKKGLDWYLDLRRYGGIPTAGFGMGFERYLQLISAIKNIRDVIPFPRYPHNCKM